MLFVVCVSVLFAEWFAVEIRNVGCGYNRTKVAF